MRNQSVYNDERSTTRVVVKNGIMGIGSFVVSFCSRKNFETFCFSLFWCNITVQLFFRWLFLTLIFKKLPFPRIIQNHTVLALFFLCFILFRVLNIYVDLLMIDKKFSMLFLYRSAASEDKNEVCYVVENYYLNDF